MGILWKAAPASAAVTLLARATVDALLFLSLSATAYAHSHKRPAPISIFALTGTLAEQNAEADRLVLPRIQNKNELHELVQELVRLYATPALRVKPTGDHAYLRPWAADQVMSLAQDFYNAAHAPLTLTSAVRTVKEQRSLSRWNHNAAPAVGEHASVHTTGIAFDISRSSLTRGQQRWLEWRLFYLQGIGRVLVREEYRQPCFHIVVIKQ